METLYGYLKVGLLTSIFTTTTTMLSIFTQKKIIMFAPPIAEKVMMQFG
jgi:hypothetical protein